MKNIASRSKPSEDGAVDLNNKTIHKQEFGRRLYQQLLSQKINQSELARRSGLGRDSISQYVRGRSVPTPQNLEKIAEALQIEPDDLFPNYSAQAATIENPTFQVKSVDSDASSMWLTVNTKVSTEKAIRVMQILNEQEE